MNEPHETVLIHAYIKFLSHACYVVCWIQHNGRAVAHGYPGATLCLRHQNDPIGALQAACLNTYELMSLVLLWLCILEQALQGLGACWSNTAPVAPPELHTMTGPYSFSRRGIGTRNHSHILLYHANITGVLNSVAHPLRIVHKRAG